MNSASRPKCHAASKRGRRMTASHRKNIAEILGRGSVHPFPARMSPGIAIAALKEQKKNAVVADPMMGSGTVLAIARSMGHRTVGVDLDPLAVLISKVWTTPIESSSLKTKGSEVLKRAKLYATKLRIRDAYPVGADAETKKFIRYWFDAHARRQLCALAVSISRVHELNLRNALWCAFSRLIITKQSGASLAMDLSHSRPHRAFSSAPTKPFSKFIDAVATVTASSPQKGSSNLGPRARIERGDARELPIKSGSVDLVLTSPPYLNAIDYMRCSKFSLVWMGYTTAELRSLRGVSVGTEVSLSANETSPHVQEIAAKLNLRPKLKSRDAAILARYIHDRNCAVSEVARVLAPDGKAVYVIGNSSVRGTFVRNSSVLEAVAKRNGLRLVAKRSRSLPPNRRYLPPPTYRKSGHTFQTRMAQEVVLAFKHAP